jgi:hypothetical protein
VREQRGYDGIEVDSLYNGIDFSSSITKFVELNMDL